jgi:FixJ family two-component response regulator
MTSNSPVVFVVDDDARVRDALASLLASAGREVAVFASATEFLRADKPDAPACLVLDLELPDITGSSCRRNSRNAGTDRVVTERRRALVGEGHEGRCVEFLSKPFGDDELLRAIDAAIEARSAARAETIERAELARRYERLTPREREVGRCCRWLCHKVTADALGTSEITIGVHRGQIMRKMGARSLAELVRFADKLGIPPHENV